MAQHIFAIFIKKECDKVDELGLSCIKNLDSIYNFACRDFDSLCYITCKVGE